MFSRMSILIVGYNSIERKKKALELAQDKFQSKSVDIVFINNEEGEIGIAEVKEAKRKSILKPYFSPSKTLIFLELHRSSLAAQNALLKLVEEPPANTFIIITADNENLLPAPIVSRCQLIKLKEDDKGKKVSDEEINFILFTSMGEKMEKAEFLSKNKEEAITYLKSLIINLRKILLVKLGKTKEKIPEKLEKKSSKELILLIRKIQKGLNTVENSNVNLRLFLENILLEITAD